jgi:hypothetical protein
MKLFIFSVLALFIAIAVASGQTAVVTCPAGFTFVPNAMPPSCVPPMMSALPAPQVMVAPMVDPNVAYESALLQAQLAQQQALQQQMQMHQIWRMMHPEPGGVVGHH